MLQTSSVKQKLNVVQHTIEKSAAEDIIRLQKNELMKTSRNGQPPLWIMVITPSGTSRISLEAQTLSCGSHISRYPRLMVFYWVYHGLPNADTTDYGHKPQFGPWALTGSCWLRQVLLSYHALLNASSTAQVKIMNQQSK